MGLAKLLALLMIFLLLGSSFVGLIIYFIKWIQLRIGNFFKLDQNKILWVHICTKELTGIAITINKWWKKRYPEYKLKIVPKKRILTSKNARSVKTAKINIW